MSRPQYSRIYFSLVGLGVAIVAVATFLGFSFYHSGATTGISQTMAATIALAATAVFYRFRLLLSARTLHYMLGRALLQWGLVVLFSALAYVVLPDTHLQVTTDLFLQWAIFTVPVLLPVLLAMRASAHRVYATDVEPRVSVLLEPGDVTLEFANRIRRSPALGLRLLGYFQDAPEGVSRAASLPGDPLPCLGSLDDATARIHAQEFDVVLLGMDLLRHPKSSQIMATLADSTASVYLIPEPHMLGGFSARSADIAGIAMLALHENRILGLSRLIKRGFDVAAAGVLLVLLSPVLLAIVVAIKLDSPGPVLFRQRRYGHSGEPIWVRKFRSMRVGTDRDGIVVQATQNDPRVTRVGRFLRRSSLDELPQLFNVLDGSMSLVGPRPHAAEHNEFYRRQIPGYMLRHTIQPGITGWAQVHGLRGETETLEKMAQRVQYDLEYIQQWTLWLDIKILFMTAWALLRHRNVY
ncbi:MAG: undecaprenyl-phosphate glucose phosphotransferase [Pigmentiphaga sp.]|nr:undecaprenyl-phosphate glucose phosphotransferase [Pigmentiphaga sp.]